MSENLSKTEEYTNANSLMLNKTKTKIFAITKDKHLADTLNLPSDVVDKPIKNNKIINMLGMKINEDLKMNYHVAIGNKSLLNQLNLRLIALRKLVKVSDQKFSKQLANAFFHSKLLFGILTPLPLHDTKMYLLKCCRNHLLLLFVIVVMQEESESIDQQCHVLREIPGTRRLLVGVETVIMINEKR